jgi:hypothetical protein
VQSLQPHPGQGPSGVGIEYHPTATHRVNETGFNGGGKLREFLKKARGGSQSFRESRSLSGIDAAKQRFLAWPTRGTVKFAVLVAHVQYLPLT